MKKLTSIILSLAVLLALCAMPVSADAFGAVTVDNAAAAPGEDVTVTFNLDTTAACSTASFTISYDTEYLTYKSWAIRGAFDEDSSLFEETQPGLLTVVVMPNNPVLFTGAFVDVTFTTVKAGSTTVQTAEEDNGFLNADYDVADATYGSGTVTIGAGSSDPVISVTAGIAGNGYVGVALTADVTVTSDGNPVASPALTYSWTIGETEVSSIATYTPDAADIGKTVKLTATYGTVTSEEASKAIAKNPAYVPSVVIGVVPESVNAGGSIVIPYTYADQNGIADASTAIAEYADAADAASWTAIAPADVTVAGGKVTVNVDGELVDKYIKVTITPANADGDTGVDVVSAAVHVSDKPVVTVSSENVTITNNTANTVDITVSVAGLTSFANIGLEIDYDTDVLTLTNVAAADITGATYTGAETINVKPYILTWNSKDDVVFNGVLATFTFNVNGLAAAGTYPVTVDFYKGQDGNYVDGVGVNYDGNDSALSFVYVNGGVTISKHFPGDIDGNKVTNDEDAIDLIRYICKWNVTVDEDALDTNGDGVVNSKDVTLLLQYLAGWDGIVLHYGR